MFRTHFPLKMITLSLSLECKILATKLEWTIKWMASKDDIFNGFRNSI